VEVLDPEAEEGIAGPQALWAEREQVQTKLMAVFGCSDEEFFLEKMDICDCSISPSTKAQNYKKTKQILYKIIGKHS